MEYNLEDLNKIYRKFKIKNGSDYWKLVIIEHIINNENNNKDFKITEETLNNMVEEIMADDGLWQEIDYSVQNVISDYITMEE
jgi:uncharacterized protein YheU (UPF0270 family)